MQWGQNSWVAYHPSPNLEERLGPISLNEPGLATYKIKSESRERESFKFFQCDHIEKMNNNKKEVR